MSFTAFLVDSVLVFILHQKSTHCWSSNHPMLQSCFILCDAYHSSIPIYHGISCSWTWSWANAENLCWNCWVTKLPLTNLSYTAGQVTLSANRSFTWNDIHLDVCKPFWRPNALPSVVTFAEVITETQPLPSRKSPRTFSISISIWRPPMVGLQLILSLNVQ